MAGGWLNGVKRDFTSEEALKEYFFFLADDALMLGQQLSKWCSKGPVLEQDIAIINTSLDHIGRARLLYQELAKMEGGAVTEDTLAYFRDHLKFRNALLLEQPNGHWGDTIARSFFFDTFNFYLFDKLRSCSNKTLAGVAEKALKEVSYQAQWSAEWVIRLGDGTEESHHKMQESINRLWMWSGELFEAHPMFDMLDDSFVRFESLREVWLHKTGEVLKEATLLFLVLSSGCKPVVDMAFTPLSLGLYLRKCKAWQGHIPRQPGSFPLRYSFKYQFINTQKQ